VTRAPSAPDEGSAADRATGTDVSVVGAPYPVLVVDRSGDVRQSNAASKEEIKTNAQSYR